MGGSDRVELDFRELPPGLRFGFVETADRAAFLDGPSLVEERKGWTRLGLAQGTYNVSPDSVVRIFLFDAAHLPLLRRIQGPIHSLQMVAPDHGELLSNESV